MFVSFAPIPFNIFSRGFYVFRVMNSTGAQICINWSKSFLKTKTINRIIIRYIRIRYIHIFASMKSSSRFGINMFTAKPIPPYEMNIIFFISSFFIALRITICRCTLCVYLLNWLKMMKNKVCAPETWNTNKCAVRKSPAIYTINHLAIDHSWCR